MAKDRAANVQFGTDKELERVIEYLEIRIKDRDNYKFILVEGGFNLLNNIIDEVDWLLIFISPKIASTKIYQLQTLNFEIIYQLKL